ncbi:MAG: VF530 family DNA-binding protein [Colwellia sp.]|nr:VF530 family DNA-binding protein [Colwellia sp.]
MSSANIYENNPLHGVKVETVLAELVDHYGWEILHAYMNLNCFKTKPSIESSVKFLRKTAWAQEKVDAFYLYQFKNLPRADDEQFLLPPPDRIAPAQHKPGTPVEISFEDAERLREKKAKVTRERASQNNGPWGN